MSRVLYGPKKTADYPTSIIFYDSSMTLYVRVDVWKQTLFDSPLQTPWK